MNIISQQVGQALQHIRSQCDARPRVGMILGTGHGGLTSGIDAEVVIPYDSLPSFPRTTAIGHAGRFVYGTLAGAVVAAMEGRFHRYEGYSWAQVTLPVRLLFALGIDVLVVTNASGGVNPQLRSGDLVVIDDQVNLMFDSPLIGPAEDLAGPRFTDMSAPYDQALIEQVLSISRQKNYHVRRGVYAGVTGPNYETRAEYRWLRRLGVDVVGMSTVPEVLVARNAGLRVVGLSAVTNICRPDSLSPASGEAVVAAAESTEPKLRDIVTAVAGRLARSG